MKVWFGLWAWVKVVKVSKVSWKMTLVRWLALVNWLTKKPTVDQKSTVVKRDVFSYGQLHMNHNASEIFHVLNQIRGILTKQHIMTMQSFEWIPIKGSGPRIFWAREPSIMDQMNQMKPQSWMYTPLMMIT